MYSRLIIASESRAEEEEWLLRKDGTKFSGNTIITPVRKHNGDITGFSFVTRDVTEKRSVMQTLQESEERYRAMVSSVKDYSIIRMDNDGSILAHKIVAHGGVWCLELVKESLLGMQERR